MLCCKLRSACVPLAHRNMSMRPNIGAPAWMQRSMSGNSRMAAMLHDGLYLTIGAMCLFLMTWSQKKESWDFRMDAIKWETKVPQLVRCGLAKYYEAKEFGWDFNGNKRLEAKILKVYGELVAEEQRAMLAEENTNLEQVKEEGEEMPAITLEEIMAVLEERTEMASAKVAEVEETETVESSREDISSSQDRISDLDIENVTMGEYRTVEGES